ncbi:Sec-independent protein translocase subunit TatA [Sinimarinibacterium thermocellulolyticum]|uniref:Sec-independent protein translocase protein TatA n=1 Tax=Sinimarinibacterium thermocellulolyticum TaxID=3170016 RepID=A0ABV2ACP1_9GAMM
MGSLSIGHWLIVLLIVLLIFGTKKLRNLGGDLGGAIKNFRASMREGEADAKASSEPLAGGDTAQTDGAAKRDDGKA